MLVIEVQNTNSKAIDLGQGRMMNRRVIVAGIAVRKQ